MALIEIDDSIIKARDAAYKRIGKLERERYAEVVKAVGEEKAKRVVIMGNGVLWCHDGKGKHDTDSSLWSELNDAGVDTGVKWTPTPPHNSFQKEDWDEAGRKLK